MTSALQLPGLDHLTSTLARYNEMLNLSPPDPDAPKAGDLVANLALDPILAAIYSKCDGGRLGNLRIFDHASLAELNESTWNVEDERVKRLFCYGRISGFMYDFATVPSLADAEGIQPVVYYIDYDDLPILPIASNVDQAFQLFALYCEKLHAAGGSLTEDPPGDRLHFPDCMTREMARDRPFVHMLEKGRFDSLLRPSPLWYPEEDRNWVRRIIEEARKLH